jgi:hypothetical protein
LQAGINANTRLFVFVSNLIGVAIKELKWRESEAIR